VASRVASIGLVMIPTYYIVSFVSYWKVSRCMYAAEVLRDFDDIERFGEDIAQCVRGEVAEIDRDLVESTKNGMVCLRTCQLGSQAYIKSCEVDDLRRASG